MKDLLLTPLFLVYLVCTLGLMVYGFNCYVMLTLFARRRRAARSVIGAMKERWTDAVAERDLPPVTTQIAIYNEYNVAERVIRAVCAMRYPAGRHEIQVLDDSTDETLPLVKKLAAELQDAGHDIHVLHRDDRTGYKAGALDAGLRVARGQFVAVFDADFVPPEDYLLTAVPFMVDDDALGFVQARWGHLNRRHSLLTRVQSIGIDGHFIIEQIARNWNGLFMNFNGTAGVWRKAAIDACGGWQWDTLTEDLDLSYRVQFDGWQTLYLPELVVPAELPEDINAFRSQQFRWAKGSVETLIKLFPRLMKAPVSPFKKLQAVLHMGGYLVHPLMLTLAMLALPILLASAAYTPATWLFVVLALPLALSVIAPSTLYIVSQKATYTDWLRRIALMPVLMVVGVGLAVSNTRAIIEAAIGHRTEFVRTPKSGDRVVKDYRIRFPWIAVAEIALGLYCAYSMTFFVASGKFLVSPFIAIYAAGFLFIGLLTFAHAYGGARRT